MCEYNVPKYLFLHYYLLMIQVNATLLKVKHEEFSNTAVHSVHLHHIPLNQHGLESLVDGCVGVQPVQAVSSSLCARIEKESNSLSLFHHLVGLVVKMSASRAEDPGFESCLWQDFCR